MRRKKDYKTETVEEFLARGGVITKVPTLSQEAMEWIHIASLTDDIVDKRSKKKINKKLNRKKKK